MTKARNEHDIETPEFQAILAPVLDPLHDQIVVMLDAGYTSADISYALTEHIHFILSSERLSRTLKRRKAAREGDQDGR